MPTDAEALLPTTSRALLHRIAVAQAEGRAPSVVAAVVRDGHQVWSGSRSCVEGHAPDTDTQYRIGSITKTFVAVLVMRLRDEGLLDLADRLDQHLPALSGNAAGTATVAQLLSHTAGLSNEPPGPWWERSSGALRPELADILQQPATRHPAGRVYHYSNVGFGLLGALVEQLRGEPWTEVLRREVLEPLGLTRTTPVPQHPHAGGWAVHPWADVLLPEPAEDAGRMAPAGQLWSTVTDLCRWAVFLGEGDPKVLGPASVAEMRAPATITEDGDSYGLGLALFTAGGLRYAGHTGSVPGFLAAVWVVPEERLAAVALSNTTSTTVGGIGSIAADLLRITAEHEPRLPEPWRPMPTVDPDLLALTGTWYWGPSAFALRLEADRALRLSPVTAPDQSVSLRAEDDGSWTALDGYWHGESLHIGRDTEGLVSHLDLGTFVFTREPYPVDGPVPGGVDPAGWREQ